ncbi:hypothetical protein PAPYR_8584 [Paratrimastix pyriformis]|uniref:SH3 domain-containing protein n=1 Tax=Paratrimastix pyriformis TaxID=342808 RepID=A0ABQ8UEJ7_9EUKA|nr:hypothetical protein PAPYR_8584 [Paratrimastix pyriformis]
MEQSGAVWLGPVAGDRGGSRGPDSGPYWGSPGAANLPLAMARHRYVASPGAEPPELSFRKGELIEVIRQHETGWWVGRLQGQPHTGWFPSSFVQLLEGPQ